MGLTEMYPPKGKTGLINKMSIEEALADVKNEGDVDPFASFDKENETPTESQPETNDEVVEPEVGEEGDDEPENTPEDNIPFHKHPRWIERENEIRALREEREEMARSLSELNSFKEEVSSKFKESDREEIPEWFVELFGDNETAWKKYSEGQGGLREEIKQEIINSQREEQERIAKEQEHWTNWAKTGVEELQAEGHKFNPNELYKVMLDYAPTDEDNNLDFRKGLRILEAIKPKETIDPAKSQARKQIADAATKSSGGGRKVADYQTPETLKGKSWNSL